MSMLRVHPPRHSPGRTFWRVVAGAAARGWLCAAALASGEAASQVYLRTGISVALDASAQFTDVDCTTAMPAALYGCGAGGDGAPLRTAGSFGASTALEVGAGYALSPTLRIELRMTYRPSVAFGGRANFLAPHREQSVAVDGSSLAGLVAAEVELPAAFGRGLGGFRPFAGAAVGRVRHRLGETHMSFPATETFVPRATHTQWTWAVTAGVARALGQRTTLELAWRYTEQGDVRTGTGAGRVQWRDGSRTLALDLAPTRAGLRHHGAGLSVRYAW